MPVTFRNKKLLLLLLLPPPPPPPLTPPPPPLLLLLGPKISTAIFIQLLEISEIFTMQN
jgi:hypothetical protein